MTIEVTGCHDCPFKVQPFWDCLLIKKTVIKEAFEHKPHQLCPLKQYSITSVKLKEDEKQENGK